MQPPKTHILTFSSETKIMKIIHSVLASSSQIIKKVSFVVAAFGRFFCVWRMCYFRTCSILKYVLNEKLLYWKPYFILYSLIFSYFMEHRVWWRDDPQKMCNTALIFLKLQDVLEFSAAETFGPLATISFFLNIYIEDLCTLFWLWIYTYRHLGFREKWKTVVMPGKLMVW